MYFENRDQAALLLAEKLAPYASHHPLVLGVPRGAVPMAKVLSDRLNGDLDVVLVHKVGAPGNPEYAIGSVTEFGAFYETQIAQSLGIPSGYLKEAVNEEIDTLKRRRATYSPIRPPIAPTGRTVIIVDDGIATGATILAAIRAVRSQRPKRIIVAAPVASSQAVDLLSAEADDIVVLYAPEDFYAIGDYYFDFSQVTDEEVVQLLSESAQTREHRREAS